MDWESVLKELEKVKKEYNDRLESINKSIETIKSISSGINMQYVNNITQNNDIYSKYGDFNPTLPTRSKVVYVINKEKRFLHVREIADILDKIDTTNKSLKSNISNAVSSLGAKDKLTKLAIGSSKFNVFWGKAEWLDENGKPKPDYSYDERQLTSNVEDLL